MELHSNIYIPIVKGCGIGNILKGFISFLSLNENTKITCDNSYIMGDYQNVFHEKHIIYNPPSDYKPFFSWRFLILLDEESAQKHLTNELTDMRLVENINKTFKVFSTKVCIDSYYKRNLISDNVYNRIMNGVRRIQWNEIIIREVNKLTHKLSFPALAISVRTWEAIHEKNVTNYRKFNINDYISAINEVTNNKENKIKSIYISYDNHKVEPFFLEYLKDFEIIKYEKPNDISDLQYAIIKMLLCSKCDHFICNRISTFSELVFWFNECKQNVVDI